MKLELAAPNLYGNEAKTVKREETENMSFVFDKQVATDLQNID